MSNDKSEALQKRLDQFDAVVKGSGSKALQDFADHVAEMNVTERNRDPQDPQLGKAHHRSFNSTGNFVGQVVYDEEKIIDFDDWVTMRIHEMVHASQHHHSPVFYAQPGNFNTDIWLSPADFVLARMMCELDAYAKQGWLTAEFMSAADSADPEADHSHPSLDQSVSEAFNQIASQDDYDLRKSLAHLALIVHNDVQMPSFDPEDNGKILPLSFNYQRNAIIQYLAAMGAVAKRSGKEALENATYVRLSDEELIAMTSTFGPSPIMKGDGSMVPIYGADKLFKELLPALRNIERSLGIEDRDDLPTLSEALAERGLSQDEFMNQARKKAPSPK